MSSKPVYGLIFLYEWTNEDESNEDRQECPKHLWFGNQVCRFLNSPGSAVWPRLTTGRLLLMPVLPLP
jgi:hypothetical protein